MFFIVQNYTSWVVFDPNHTFLLLDESPSALYHHVRCLTLVVNRICSSSFQARQWTVHRHSFTLFLFGLSTELSTKGVMLFLCNSLVCCSEALVLLLNSALHLPAVSMQLHHECVVLLCTSYAQIIP